MYSRAANKTAGTGLSTEDFIAAMKESGKHGNLTEAQALNMTHEQARWSRFTGAELSTIQKYGGTAYRYAGETDGASTAYAGLMAQNMGKGQYSEFLNSMGRIMEEGISKGFIRSSKEVAGNMAMLYKLSGNSPLWQGEQGAQRLSQMNNALANATNLNTTEDFISFGVVKNILGKDGADWESEFKRMTGANDKFKGGVYTGGIADIMQILERGVHPDILLGQFNAVDQLERGSNGKLDSFGAISRFKTMYGLNYSGAAQVYEMMINSRIRNEETGEWEWKEGYKPEETAKKIEELRTNPHYASDSERLTTAINKMTDGLAQLGSFKFEDELRILEAQKKTVDDILQEIKIKQANADVLPSINFSEMSLRERAAITIPERHAAQLTEKQMRLDADALNRAIVSSRLSSLDAAMFSGGRAARGSGSPDNYGFFDSNYADDKSALERLMAYRDSESIQAQSAFLQSLDVLRAFSYEQQRAINDSNAVNLAIPNVMTDVTGQQLLRAIQDLARDFRVNITLNE